MKEQPPVPERMFSPEDRLIAQLVIDLAVADCILVQRDNLPPAMTERAYLMRVGVAEICQSQAFNFGAIATQAHRLFERPQDPAKDQKAA